MYESTVIKLNRVLNAIGSCILKVELATVFYFTARMLWHLWT